MPSERFFYDKPLREKKTLTIEGEEAQHLRVMRVNIGDEIEVINGKGQLAKASVIEFHKGKVDLLATQVFDSPLREESLILCLALPRFNRLEWVIEKGAELGVSAFWVFPGDLSEKKELSEPQSVRLRHLLIAAIKQCGRLDLPAITLKEPLAKWVRPQGTSLFGDTDPKAPRIATPYPHPIYFFSGPEKGFSQKELDLFHRWEAKGVSLHRNILRADTAPIAAAAILSTL